MIAPVPETFQIRCETDMSELQAALEGAPSLLVELRDHFPDLADMLVEQFRGLRDVADFTRQENFPASETGDAPRFLVFGKPSKCLRMLLAAVHAAHAVAVAPE